MLYFVSIEMLFAHEVLKLL